MKNYLGNGLPDRNEAEALYKALRPSYEEALQKLYRHVRTLLEKQGHTPTVKYRVKRFKNYFDKLANLSRRSGGRSPIITDLLGMRIICPFLEDLETVEQLLAGSFEVLELERKRGRHSFREFGYDSVHMLIRVDPGLLRGRMPHTTEGCEIQLRTILQDAWAEVEHELVYKSDITLPNESIKRKLAALNATLSLSDLIFQEIRDFQKDIRQKGHKRRQSLLEGSLTSDLISISSPPPFDAAETASPLPESMPLENGNNLERAMLEALEAHSNNDLESAIALYTRILQMRPQSGLRSLVYNHRGMAFFSRSEYKRAVGDFSRAIHFDRSNVRVYTNRGLTYRVTGRYNDSIEDYDRALTIDPFCLEGYLGRAQTFFEMKLFTKALADCEQALKLSPAFAPAEELLKMVRRHIFQ